jgi:hypothetical protein
MLHRLKFDARERPLPFSANLQFRDSVKNSGRDFYNRKQRLMFAAGIAPRTAEKFCHVELGRRLSRKISVPN